MAAEQEKGMSIFLDVFRRADKNDDNALSWDEFRSFFADGVLSEEEIKDLFNEIDTHNTNNIDTGELCSYFSSHMGEFKGIFSALEDLTQAVSGALNKSAKEYPGSSTLQQFTTRFMVREILQQMTAIQRPMDAASDALDTQASEQSVCGGGEVDGSGQASAAAPLHSQPAQREVNEDNIDALAAAGGSIIPGRHARRARRQISSQTSMGVLDGMDGGALGQQVERLRTLVDRMESKVSLDGMVEEDFVDFTAEELLLVVQRKMTAEEQQVNAFKSSLRAYVEASNKSASCLHIHVRGYSGTNSFVVYEIWGSEEDWKHYNSCVASRTFRHRCVDLLETPETTSTLKIPGTWWTRA